MLQNVLIAIVAAVLIFLGGFATGYKWVSNSVVASNVKVEKKQEVQHEQQTLEAGREGDTFKAAKAAPLAQPAPVIRVCPPIHPMPRPSTAGPLPDVTPAHGSDDQAGSTAWDSAPVVKAGRDADAQIAGLQDYIRNVCKPK